MTRRYKANRARARTIAPSELLALADSVRALLKAEPSLTAAELIRRTGAPQPLVTLVRRRWRAAKAKAAAT